MPRSSLQTSLIVNLLTRMRSSMRQLAAFLSLNPRPRLPLAGVDEAMLFDDTTMHVHNVGVCEWTTPNGEDAPRVETAE